MNKKLFGISVCFAISQPLFLLFTTVIISYFNEGIQELGQAAILPFVSIAAVAIICAIFLPSVIMLKTVIPKFVPQTAQNKKVIDNSILIALLVTLISYPAIIYIGAISTFFLWYGGLLVPIIMLAYMYYWIAKRAYNKCKK